MSILETMSKYGVTPDMLRPRNEGGRAHVEDRLRAATADVIEAEKRFSQDLEDARRSKLHTPAGIAARAGDAGRRLMGDVAAWVQVADLGREAIADLDRDLAAPAEASDDVVAELRRAEIRGYLKGMDGLVLLPILLDAVADGDAETVAAVLDAPRSMKLVSAETAEQVRRSWSDRTDPGKSQERAEISRLVKTLDAAVATLKRTIAKATNNEVGAELDPLQRMAIGLPETGDEDEDRSARRRKPQPDPIARMAAGDEAA